MHITIPLVQGRLSAHFGHCERFAIIEIDDNSKRTANRQDLSPPAHEPGALPKWLAEMNVNVIIAGGMGQRAQQLFAHNNIEVIVGASDAAVEDLVEAYLAGTLQTGDNICDH